MATSSTGDPLRERDSFAPQLCGAETWAGKFLRRFWHPVELSENLKPGRAKPIRALGEDFTLYRGSTGHAHAVDYACAHRCTQLSVGTIEDDNIRCLYHGWMYDSSGQCIDQPSEPEPFAAKIKIRSLPTAEYLGLIFCYFGADAPPPLPRYPKFEDGGLQDNSYYLRECNYYQNLDNHGDSAHVPFAHRLSLQKSMTALGLNHNMPMVSAEETDYGLASTASWPDGRTRTIHLLMPNMNQFTVPSEVPGEKGWTDHLAWRVPIDDDRHYSCSIQVHRLSDEGLARYHEFKRQTEERLAKLSPTTREMISMIRLGAASLDDAAARADIVTLEDAVSQEGQGRIVDHSKEHLGRSDATLILRRKIHLRELRALAEGRPLKEWTVPQAVIATTGVA
jgi:5,5'-dehydrodivanillate O-demethylase oxygenase subunit